MKGGEIVASIFGGLIFLGALVAVVSPKSNGGQVVNDVFGGTSQVFGTILSPVGASKAS